MLQLRTVEQWRHRKGWANYSTVCTAVGCSGIEVQVFGEDNIWVRFELEPDNQRLFRFFPCSIMNEPHDQEINEWVPQVQAAVNAIRALGASKQYILLPGVGWTGGGSFISVNEPALSKVTDPTGGTAKLVYDIHQYLDGDSSGTSTECVSDKISQIFSPITALLQAKGRKAFLSEVGGGNTACEQDYFGATCVIMLTIRQLAKYI